MLFPAQNHSWLALPQEENVISLGWPTKLIMMQQIIVSPISDFYLTLVLHTLLWSHIGFFFSSSFSSIRHCVSCVSLCKIHLYLELYFYFLSLFFAHCPQLTFYYFLYLSPCVTSSQKPFYLNCLSQVAFLSVAYHTTQGMLLTVCFLNTL